MNSIANNARMTGDAAQITYRFDGEPKLVPGSVQIVGGPAGPHVVDHERGTVTFGTFSDALRSRFDSTKRPVHGRRSHK